MNDKKRVPVFYKSDRTYRYTDPIQQQTPRDARGSTPVVQSPSPTEIEAKGVAPVPKVLPEPAEEDASGPANESGTSAKGKPKPEITTLQQFLVHAYGLKGRRVSIKEKVLQEVSRNIQIPVEGLVELQKLAKADKQFCVPRQILLAAREIEGYPAVKESIRNFVQDVMLSHPIYKNPKVAAAIRNLPEASPPHAALKLVMEEVVEKEDSDETIGKISDAEKSGRKPVDAAELKANAANCLAVWFAVTKHLSLEEVTDALSDAVWVPVGRSVQFDIVKLRALTGIERPEGIGLACELYRRRARDLAALADRVSSEVSGLRSLNAEAQQLFELTNSELHDSKITLEKLKKESSEEIEALHARMETQAAHLRDDFEKLRSRVLRRLVADADALDVGLSALQSPEPRVHVIRDRVERVIDALRSEINKLREE